jgi:hypothetical protein
VTGAGNLEGSVLLMRSTGAVTIDGVVQSNGRGFSGGLGTAARQGASQLGSGGSDFLNNGGGGGGGEDITIPPGGGGGGHATAGADGQQTSSGGFPTDQGRGGTVYGETTLDVELHLGSGGGSGGVGLLGGATLGGRGGGLLFISAPTLTINGAVEANGNDGEDGNGSVIDTAGGAGGGAGGTIWLRAQTFAGSGAITSVGGNGGAAGFGVSTTGSGGDGGDGRVRLDGPGTGGFTVTSGSQHSGPTPTAGVTTAVGTWSIYR